MDRGLRGREQRSTQPVGEGIVAGVERVGTSEWVWWQGEVKELPSDEGEAGEAAEARDGVGPWGAGGWVMG